MNNKSLKVNDLKCVINEFFKEIEKDKDGRCLSFEYIYKAFDEYCKSPNDDLLDITSLHLYAYLSSWGMLRNSFLLYKSYTFNNKLLQNLKEYKNNNKEYDAIKIEEKIKNFYIGKTYHKDNENQTIKSITDTLVTKIIMGTFGIVPAYDKYFKVTAKNLGITQSFGAKSIQQLKKFISTNATEIQEIKKNIYVKRGIDYSEMKIVDMYFWQKGYDMNK